MSDPFATKLVNHIRNKSIFDNKNNCDTYNKKIQTKRYPVKMIKQTIKSEKEQSSPSGRVFQDTHFIGIDLCALHFDEETGNHYAVRKE